MAGHASPMSLRPYLNFVLARRVSLTEAARRERLAEVSRHLERKVLKLKAELNACKGFAAAVGLARRGKQGEAEELLSRALEDGTLWAA